METQTENKKTPLGIFLTFFLLPVWPYLFIVGFIIGNQIKREVQAGLEFSNKDFLLRLKTDSRQMFPIWARYIISTMKWLFLIKYLFL